MTEAFTADELRTAASRLGHSMEIERVLMISTSPDASYDLDMLKRAALVCSCAIATSAVLSEARRLREPSITSDDDVLTVGELRAWLKRGIGEKGFGGGITVTLGYIDKMMADIVSHREPEYPEGTVVEVQDGGRYRRTANGDWQVLGTVISDKLLARPLKVVS
jgi:hypothetical protein